jgi:2-C-methyl-D-erythritol 4-phosphate cytidylyltransferase
MTIAQKYFALLPAAGSGTRSGLPYPKVLFELQSGHTILARTVTTFVESDLFAELIVLAPREYIAQFLEQVKIFPKVRVIAGGATRQASVLCGLQELEKRGAGPTDVVAIHDVARCFVTTDLICKSVACASAKGAAIVAVPVVDLIKEIDTDSKVKATLNRNVLRMVQTPQTFRFDLIMRGHKAAAKSDGAFDDAQLVEPFHPVEVIAGDPRNIKVTSPLDFELAKLRTGSSL